MAKKCQLNADLADGVDDLEHGQAISKTVVGPAHRGFKFHSLRWSEGFRPEARFARTRGVPQEGKRGIPQVRSGNLLDLVGARALVVKMDLGRWYCWVVRNGRLVGIDRPVVVLDK
jgi:hypothetical protein